MCAGRCEVWHCGCTSQYQRFAWTPQQQQHQQWGLSRWCPGAEAVCDGVKWAAAAVFVHCGRRTRDITARQHACACSNITWPNLHPDWDTLELPVIEPPAG